MDKEVIYIQLVEYYATIRRQNLAVYYNLDELQRIMLSEIS